MTDSSETYPFDTAINGRPIQFRLRSLLMFMALAAGLFGLTELLELGKPMAIFGIGFLSVAAVISAMMSAAQRAFVPIREFDKEDEAHMCRNFLEDRDIRATIQTERLGGMTGLNLNVSRVMVHADKLDQARQALAGNPAFTQKDRDGGQPRDPN